MLQNTNTCSLIKTICTARAGSIYNTMAAKDNRKFDLYVHDDGRVHDDGCVEQT